MLFLSSPDEVMSDGRYGQHEKLGASLAKEASNGVLLQYVSQLDYRTPQVLLATSSRYDDRAYYSIKCVRSGLERV